MEGFSKPEPKVEPELPTINYRPGDEVVVVVKDVPRPEELLPNGRPKDPVGFSDSDRAFIVILTNPPKDIKVGQRLKVTLTKITKSYGHKKLAFGACL